MTVSDLRKKIEDAGGALALDNIIFTCSEGNDIDCKTSHGHTLFAWWSTINDSKADALENISLVSDRELLPLINSLITLAQFLGITVGEIKPLESVRVEVRESAELHRLAGKVEAYENILIGREFTVRK